MKYPKCEQTTKQLKIGKTIGGSQRYRCYFCRQSYTPIKKQKGYSVNVRQKAIRFYIDGMGLRRIGRQLGVHHHNVANWTKAHSEKLPQAPVPAKVKTAELEEFLLSLEREKQNLCCDTRKSIQGILESAKEYAYGYKVQSRDGETYQIPVEPIIGIPTYELFKTQREKNKTNSPQQIRHDYLLSGYLKCSCNLTWQARTATHRRSRKGEWIERKTPIGTYFCPQPHRELRASTCPKTVSAKHAEAQVWEKVSQFITDPDYLLAQAKEKVAQLQLDYQQMQQDELQLQAEIKKLNDQRQEFITKARKERMSDEEFSPQISEHYDRELRVQRKLTFIEQEKDAFTKLDLEEQVKKYVADLQSEITELINANPQTSEERHQVFLLKKRIVDTVLVELRIDGNREIQIKFRTDFLNRVEQTYGVDDPILVNPTENIS